MTRRTVITVAAMLGMFLAAIDQTAVGTAMPSITKALGGFALYSWVFAAYQLAFVVTTPIFGRLADLYGRKRVYLAGIVGFIGASVLCGASQSMGQLVGFRLLQGIGGGAVLPIALTIVGDLYAVEERLRIQGIFSGVWGVAAIVGPLLGGFLADHASWRWIFFLNVPAGIVATAIIAATFAEPITPRAARLDYAGIALLTGAAVAVLLLLLWGGQTFPWRSPQTAAMLALAAGLVVAFLRVERRIPQPFLPLSLFEDRVMSVGSAGGFLLGASMFGAIVYIPLFVQGVIGTSATTAGLVLMPFMVCWTFGSIAGGQAALWRGYRPVMTTGTVLLVAGFGMLAGLTAQASLGRVVAAMVVLGTAMGLTTTMFMVAMQSAVTHERRGIVTSVNIFSRNMGGAIGISLQGAVLIAGLTSRLRGGRAPTITDPQSVLNATIQTHLGAAELEVFRSALAQALHSIFLLGLGLAALGLLVVLLYMPRGSVVDLTPANAAGGAEAD